MMKTTEFKYKRVDEYECSLNRSWISAAEVLTQFLGGKQSNFSLCCPYFNQSNFYLHYNIISWISATEVSFGAIPWRKTIKLLLACTL